MTSKLANEGYNSEMISSPTTESKPSQKKVITRNTECCKYEKDVIGCDSFLRILNILKKYEKWIDCKQKQKVPFCNIINDQSTGYNNSILLDDYHHIIYYHSVKDVYNNSIKINKIECTSSINDCICLNRNYRDRISDNNKLYFGLSEYEINTEQIMDQIHCYMYHSYDLGYFLTDTQMNYINDKNNFYNDKVISLLSFNSCLNPNTLSFTDSVLKDRKQRNKLHLENDEMMNGYHKIKKMKHILNNRRKCSAFYRRKFIADRLMNNRTYEEQEHKHIEHKSNVFTDYGIKYEYYNESDTHFVEPKYNSLKCELLNLITIKQFDILYIKTMNHFNKQYTKQIKTKDVLKRISEYINTIELQHILSVIIYCNFSHIEQAFNETFKEYNCVQHECYANLGRYLFEMVQYFGNKTNSKNTFYYCFSDVNVYYLSESHYISCPFSVTNKLNIAMIMLMNKNMNGIIIECKEDSLYNSMSYFDCRSMSDFCSENEQMFVGNHSTERFRVNKIVNINYCYDYYMWLRVINIIRSFITGQYLMTKYLNYNIKQNVIMLLKSQQRTKLDGNSNANIPIYIQNLMRLYVENVHKITIRWPDIDHCYSFMKTPFLFDSKCNFIRLDILLSIFNNCKELCVHGSLNKTLKFSKLIMESIYQLLMKKKKCNDNILKIEIKWIDNLNSSLSFGGARLLYKERFNEILYDLFTAKTENGDDNCDALIIQHQ